MRTKIIYEDEHILVCYKPAGLATQTAKVGQPDVVSELKNYLSVKKSKDASSKGYLGVVHRLDQPVEGLLVFAGTKKAAAGLSAQLSEGILNKRYYAVVCGQPAEEEGELVDNLAKTADNRAVISDNTVKAGRAAEPDKPAASGSLADDGRMSGGTEAGELQFRRAALRYRIIGSRTIDQITGQSISLADIHIETGRFHQIRAQMSHAGMPLLGDVKYGTGNSVDISRRFNVRSVALCAYEIELKHPVTGKRMHFAIRPEGEIFGKFDFFGV